jgi:hypothetical protein
MRWCRPATERFRCHLYPLGLLYILATEQAKVVSRLASGLIGLVGYLEAENLEEIEPYRR